MRTKHRICLKLFSDEAKNAFEHVYMIVSYYLLTFRIKVTLYFVSFVTFLQRIAYDVRDMTFVTSAKCFKIKPLEVST